MPLYKLEWSLETKNVTKIKPQEDEFQWSFKLLCTKCHEKSERVNFRQVDEIEIPNSRGTSNFVMKCKFCDSLGTVDIVPKSLLSFDSDKIGFQTLCIIEGRGYEPIEW